MKPLHLFAGLVSICLLTSTTQATLVLASPFSDHAVLQRDIVVPVWGWDGPPGSLVTVSYGGQSKTTPVGKSGLWRVNLDPMLGSATGSDLIVTGSTAVTLRDVVVGEVWIASGQSNMEWPLEMSRGLAEEKARPPNPLIRQLHLEHAPADLPVATVQTGGWQTAAPDTVGGFTGVGYFFARFMADKLRVPIGLIHSSWGGSPIESWLPEPVLRTSSAWPRFEAEWRSVLKGYAQKHAEQSALVAAWDKAQQEFQTNGQPATMSGPRPSLEPGPPFGPGTLFNGMIAPLAPYAMRGALWYQGESNVGRQHEYAGLLPAMITAWRVTWPQGDFPFLIVQLPNFTDNNNNPSGRAWAQLREAQTVALRLPATGMAVTVDGDEPGNMHPVNKRMVGERLALIALSQVHGQSGFEWSGPVFLSMEHTGPALRLHFTHAADLHSTTATITGFEIAGADRVFHAAVASFDQDAVVVSSPAVEAPVAVRYAYTNAPAASLANSDGLPAAPFRTDDW